MAVLPGSRYTNSQVTQILMPDGSVRATLQRVPPVPRKITHITLTVDAGTDRADTIAQRVFGSDDLWWAVADANPERFWWDDLPPGIPVRVPSGPSVR